MVINKISLIKTLTYRILGTAVSSLIAYLFTGSIIVAGAIGLVDAIVMMIVYYIHEEFWKKFSKTKKPNEIL